MKIEIYSDVMCPWCYIGERRFQRALSAFPGSEQLEVVYRPYQLDSTTPEQPTPMNDYLQRKFGPRLDDLRQHVSGAARAEGIRMDYDNGVIVNTLKAHRLLRLAEREYGAEIQRALAEKLFEAHFERGADVSDHDVLTELAASTGMDAERVRTYLASNEGREETQAELANAVERGVRAVPTFVFDNQYAIEGAQPTSTFLKVLEELTSASSSEAGGTADGAVCADDSCAV